MCFLVSNRRIKIAKQDIACIKYGAIEKNVFTSIIKAFPYLKDQLYKVNVLLDQYYHDGKGIEEGFHSYINNPRENCYSLFSRDKALFIIPKGSRYLIDLNFNEYVSNQIIFKRKL